MNPLQLTQQESCQQKSDLYERKIPLQNTIQGLIFLISLIFLDTCFFIQHSNIEQFMTTKIGINLIFILYIFVRQKKLTYFQINVFYLFSKGISVFFMFLFEQDYLLIIALLLQDNYKNTEPWEFILQRIFVEIGCIIIFSLQQQMFGSLVVVSILFMEFYKCYIQLKKQKAQSDYQITSSKNKFTQNQKQSFFNKNREYLNKIINFPLYQIEISYKDQKVFYTNDCFKKQFKNQFKFFEGLDNFIQQELIFEIILENNLESQGLEIFKELIPQEVKIQNFKKGDNQNNSQTMNGKKYSLNQILSICENKGTNQILEIICQHNLNENTLITYAGQIIINKDEDEVILVLVDITKQIEFQEEKIKDQFKSSIVQSFSHELRTPLNSSLNFLQYCENDKNINDEIKKNFISPAINAIHLQSYLINDIIDFSSLCSDNFKLDVINVTVEQIVNEVNRLFKSVLQMKNLELYILANLLQNSIKYTTKGTIILKISSKSQSSLKISIKDEGYGIEECRLKQIKSMLREVKADKNFSQQENWHGFGLLVTQMLLLKLSSKHKKSLTIKSKGRDQGTKIKFVIQNHKTINTQKDKIIEILVNNISQTKTNLHIGNPQYSLNGTMLVIGENNEQSLFLSQSIKKITIPFLHIQKSTFNKFSKINYQLKQIEENEENHSGQLELQQPSEKISKPHQMIRLKSSSIFCHHKNRIINYEQFKQQEEIESQKQLKKYFENMKCNCKRKILSVDDEIFNQKSIQFLLNQQGFEVTLAFNGEEAIKIVQETEKCSLQCSLFLIILMDYQMPIMNGIQTTKKLKQMMDQQLIPKINIIGLTAFTSKNDIEKCLNAGMKTVLSKPLQIGEFLEIIKAI